MIETAKLGIKDLALEDRPREKLMQKGLLAMTDAELIAIIIASGNRNESAVELAQKILKSYQNNLNELGKATVEQLKNNFLGVGDAKALTIVAAMELGRRRTLQGDIVEPVIQTTYDVVNIFHPLLSDLDHEEIWGLLLNKANKVKYNFNISKGGITETITDIRLIFKKALEIGATAIIMCHNHPSGNLKPSKSDIELTKRMVEAGKIMDIKILDHIIISNKDFFSFKEQDMLY
jgi:DNA repair protein RadC